ncbi:MAG: glycosyltransferase [Methanobacterium sp.]|nr:glycosyltransferase [Methanobacterium sp.]
MSLFRFISYLNKHKPNIVLSTLTNVNMISFAANFFSKTKVKLFLRIAIPESKQAEMKASSKFMFLLNSFFYRVVSKSAIPLIAVSESVKKDLVEKFNIPKERITTIYNPVDILGVLKRSRESIFHKWFKEKTPIILSIGSLTFRKNYMTLIKAFYLLRKKIKAKLIILGQGPEKEKLERSISILNLDKEVDLPGFFINPHAYIARCAVYVSSSLYEGCGNTLTEAMVLNVPIVATNGGGSSEELLEYGKWGRIVPACDEKALSDAILATLQEKEKKDLHQRAHDFRLEEIGEQYLKTMGLQ